MSILMLTRYASYDTPGTTTKWACKGYVRPVPIIIVYEIEILLCCLTPRLADMFICI